ncbi:DUF4145 domain-containing protein [Bacillus safensis]|uniref:DUF4145 domain-containing protein n=1 Tax=Bacillus safensis TaxID=561879 RepID=UPI000B43D451|nr:DUF4145 domain-containing protein [Bacillus safensis]UDB49877.1 DUF4145 domain-containing protein [Bacillus safensis]
MRHYENERWINTVDMEGERFSCGYCNSLTAPNFGYITSEYNISEYHVVPRILICPNCNKATYLDEFNQQYPPANSMRNIKHLPSDVQELYKEVCDSYSVHAYTGASILARKMIMNVAVEKEAKKGKNFVYYVEFLVDNAVVPKSTKKWLDAVRENGNEAAHETQKSSREDTEKIINFLEILLRSVYEFEGEI